jgi:hypothetical protein
MWTDKINQPIVDMSLIAILAKIKPLTGIRNNTIYAILLSIMQRKEKIDEKKINVVGLKS